jgi:hypothetical protein
MMTNRRQMIWRRGAGIAGALLFGVPLLVAGPLVTTGAAEPSGPTGSPAGRALGTGVFATYSDQENFFPGAATVPPSTWAPLAAGGFENNGIGFARAAFAYNPYQDAAGAVNALTPAEFPQLPFDELKSRAQASVEGEAPQARDASVSPEGGLPGGTVRAGLEEEGPAAVSEVIAANLVPAPEMTIRAVTSRSRVSQAGGHAASEASTLLQGVTLGGVLTFESIRVEASSTADGGPGRSTAAVQVNGVAVNGTPVVINDQGVVASDNNVPVGAGPIAAALEAAGVELLAPGRASVKPAGSNSVAEARGPSFRLTTSDNREVELVLGLASTASVLFDVNEEPAALPVGDDASGDSDSPAPAAGAAPAPEPAVANVPGVADRAVNRSTPPAGRLPASLTPSPDMQRFLPGASGDDPLGMGGALSPSQGEAPAAPAADSLAAPAVALPPGVAPTRTLGLASANVTSRVNALYAVLAVAGGALLLLALAVPPGNRWAEEG